MATLKKHGARKPLVSEGSLTFGNRNYVNGQWEEYLLSIGESDDVRGDGFTLEIGRNMAVEVAVYFAGSLTHVEAGIGPDQRTGAQRLRALADMIEGEAKG